MMPCKRKRHYSATSNIGGRQQTARLLGVDDQVGALAPGARDWLLGVKEDPRRNPSTLNDPVWRNF